MQKSKCKRPVPNILHRVQIMTFRKRDIYMPLLESVYLDALPIMSDNEVIEFFNDIDELVKDEDSYD